MNSGGAAGWRRRILGYRLGRSGVGSLEFALIIPVLFTLMFGTLAAVVFHNKFPMRGLLRGLFIMPMMATPVAIALVWTMMFHPQLGVLNYLLTGISVKAGATVTLTFTSSTQNISHSLVVPGVAPNGRQPKLAQPASSASARTAPRPAARRSGSRRSRRR